VLWIYHRAGSFPKRPFSDITITCEEHNYALRTLLYLDRSSPNNDVKCLAWISPAARFPFHAYFLLPHDR
jgi:hypothetical protein